MQSTIRQLSAEFLGTFALVLAGTGAIVADAASGGQVSPVGIALVFGLVVMAVIYSVGDVSGAQLNPAVSAGLWLSGRQSSRATLLYTASQCAGAVLASLCLRAVFPEQPGLGATLPAIPLGAAFLTEVLITFMLMFVIIHVVARAPESTPFGGLAIGATVALGALWAGPLTGASMNPARSLGPALVEGRLGMLWLYWSAPFVGAAVAIASCRLVRGPDCCPGPRSA